MFYIIWTGSKIHVNIKLLAGKTLTIPLNTSLVCLLICRYIRKWYNLSELQTLTVCCIYGAIDEGRNDMTRSYTKLACCHGH